MSDLEDEFAALLKEKGKSRETTKLAKQPAPGRGVGAADRKPSDSATEERAAVPAGGEAALQKVANRPRGRTSSAKPGVGSGSRADRFAEDLKRAGGDNCTVTIHSESAAMRAVKGYTGTHNADGTLRSSRGSTDREWGSAVAAFVPEEIPVSRYPKRFHPGELKRGESVWYRDERYYIMYFPTAWSKGTFARIASTPFRPESTDAEVEHLVQQQPSSQAAMIISVPVDTLQRAKTVGNPGIKAQPTKSAIEKRAEMKKAGVTDIGDPVAVMLRECTTLDDVYECASNYLDQPISKLKERYAHLNAGQQRMNLGNKMRFKAKHGGEK